ncbi:helix-turn-helix domain-containing protein [Rhodovulum sulfidophilum]|uniref:helix-turn-helix domain-containing protein n=1 Tax=Rhodovulum sulfidophilum TaxID=35806 RepID=UPI0019256D09|nr:helix-turn-helix domain-containing protein [Rhodovulum sulfidophilum]
MGDTPQPIYFRPRDAKALFGVSANTVRRWLERAGPAVRTIKMGNTRLIHREEVEVWLEANGEKV